MFLIPQIYNTLHKFTQQYITKDWKREREKQYNYERSDAYSKEQVKVSGEYFKWYPLLHMLLLWNTAWCIPFPSCSNQRMIKEQWANSLGTRLGDWVVVGMNYTLNSWPVSFRTATVFALISWPTLIWKPFARRRIGDWRWSPAYLRPDQGPPRSCPKDTSLSPTQ